ncbi:MAG: GNAT family protein [Phormidesmis sp.]
MSGNEVSGDENQKKLVKKMFSGQIEFAASAQAQRANAPKNSQGFTAQISVGGAFPAENRLHLRLLEPADAEELFALVDTNRAYLKQWLSWLNTTQTLDDTRHFIRQTQARVQDRQGFAAAMIYNDRIAGVIGLNNINWSDRKSSIGYWLAENQQGQGLVTAACKAILHHAFTHLALNRVAILCATGNHRSQAIPKRLGFTHEGTLREAQWLYDCYIDHEVYSQLRRHWTKD